MGSILSSLKEKIVSCSKCKTYLDGEMNFLQTQMSKLKIVSPSLPKLIQSIKNFNTKKNPITPFNHEAFATTLTQFEDGCANFTTIPIEEAQHPKKAGFATKRKLIRGESGERIVSSSCKMKKLQAQIKDLEIKSGSPRRFKD